MRKATIFLMALALALAAAAADTMPPDVRRSRFLANVKFSPPPPSLYDCSKKPESICLASGSPGATCCKGMCVDTESSFTHCGNCDKTCKYGQTCCGGHCVDLLNDKKNCGKCFNRCSKKHPSICLAPGSPGATCCEGMCVDTESSFAHCGNCNKTCKFGKTCCGGRCVDLLNNKKNCGNCFVQCSKKCKYGLCNYAG